MITLQHTLVTLFGQRGNEKKLDEEIAYVLMPDAIRRYCGPRQYSHFERHPSNESDISWMEYPLDIKHASKETLSKQPMHLAQNIPVAVLGETTDISTFEAHNGHLPPRYFAGVKKHLTQDYIFDDFIREKIDCSNKYNDEFYFNGQKYDGKGVRQLIADIENHGLYVLAYMLNKSYGITANQEWFDKHVKEILDKEYPQDLADGTYNYMKIPEVINERITAGDWSHLEEGPIPYSEYLKMYEEVITRMPEIDMEMQEKAKQIKKVNKPGSGTKPTKPVGPSFDDDV